MYTVYIDPQVEMFSIVEVAVAVAVAVVNAVKFNE
jgi:hypothetical protein